jgi:sodium-dependent dicarboxylate transporter 2/3/5
MSDTQFQLARDSLQADYGEHRLHRLQRHGYQRWVHLKEPDQHLLALGTRWFFIALMVSFAFLQTGPYEGLSREGQIVLTMSMFATILFITEPVPLPTVALMIVVGQVVLLGIESTEVAKSLMTDSVLFIMGALMLAVAVVKQKLDRRIAWAIVKVTGTSTVRISFGITLTCGVLASFIGEHTVAAMMLPVGITLISLTSSDPKKVKNLAAVLLLSISYGCAIAGIGTPSGGARNAIMIGYWRDFFFDPANPETRRFIVDYVTWMIYAYPIFLAQLPVVTAILFWTFKPEYPDLSRAVARLRTQVTLDGPIRPAQWMAILLFVITVFGLDHVLGTTGAGHCGHCRGDRISGRGPGALGRRKLRRELGRCAAVCSRHFAGRADERHRCCRMGGAQFRRTVAAYRSGDGCRT